MFTSGKSSNSTAAIHSSLGKKAIPAMSIPPKHPIKKSASAEYKTKMKRAASSPELYNSSPETNSPLREEKNDKYLPFLGTVAPVSKKPVSDFEAFKETAARTIIQKHPDFSTIINNPVPRTVNHLFKDAVDVLAFIPTAESEEKRMTIAHYAALLPQTTLLLLQEAHLSKDRNNGIPLYCVDNTIQNGGINTHKKMRPLSDPKAPKIPMALKSANVYMFICYGYPPKDGSVKINNGYLSGEKLQDVVNFYLSKDVASVTIYLGDYDDIKDSEENVESIGLSKRDDWLNINQTWLEHRHSGNKIKIVLREDLIKTESYQSAKAFMEHRALVNQNAYTQRLENDAVKYISGQLENESTLLLKNSGSEKSLSSSSSKSMLTLPQMPLRRSGSNSSQKKSSPVLKPSSRPTSPADSLSPSSRLEEKVRLSQGVLKTLLDDFKDLPTDLNFDRQAYIESAIFAATRILSFSLQELSNGRETSPQHNGNRVSPSINPPSASVPQALLMTNNHGPFFKNKSTATEAAAESAKNTNMLLQQHSRNNGSVFNKQK